MSDDDEAGICTAYPPTRAVASKSCEPRHGFAKECDVPLPEEDGGCSFVPERPRGADLGLGALLLAGLARHARRRRARRA